MFFLKPLILLNGLLQILMGNGWPIEETGIYSILDENAYAVSLSLHFFLMDRQDRRIQIYDRNGGFLKTIGGLGEGPGEFRYLSGIRLDENRLYALDPMASRLSLFDHDGVFLTSIEAPREALISFPYSVKMANGWVYARTLDGQIIWTDEEFENRTVLAQSQVNGGLNREDILVPAADKPLFAVSNDRERVFIYSGKGRFEILIYDVRQKSFKQPITKDLPPVPFDKNFGEQRYRQLLAYRPKAQQAEIRPEFPDFFLAMEHLAVDPDGLLVVFPGVHMMKQSTPLIVLDEAGNEASSRFPVEHLSRIMAVDGDDAFVTTYRDGEVGVRRVPIVALDRFFKQNPITPP